MTRKKIGKRLFCGMSYREIQRSNSTRKSHLSKKDQTWLKENTYRNVGWDNVIKLYQKINDLLSSSDPDGATLEDLFLKADHIGNKYQTSEEIEIFNQTLKAEVESISNAIDQQFPDEELEFADYSQQPRPMAKRKARKSRKN